MVHIYLLYRHTGNFKTQMSLARFSRVWPSLASNTVFKNAVKPLAWGSSRAIRAMRTKKYGATLEQRGERGKMEARRYVMPDSKIDLYNYDFLVRRNSPKPFSLAN
jgi:hypothetical protein